MEPVTEVLPAQPGQNIEIVENLAPVPWVAIALAVHVILLVIAWFVLPRTVPQPQSSVLIAAQDVLAQPPVPIQQPEKEHEFPVVDQQVVDPAEDPLIKPDATEDFNSDPTERPFQELAQAETDELNDPSPAPDRATNTSIGLAGGLSGGPAGGERGGMIRARSRGCPYGRPVIGPPQEEAARDWLADHQNREGYWSATSFNDDSVRTGARRTYNRELVRTRDPRGDKGWDDTVDVGLTGLSLLAFTGALHTHKDGKYKQHMRNAVTWLRRVQDNEGCFGSRADDHHVYNHAIATMAMAEVYLISDDRVLRPLVERAVQFILRMQNPGGGWRYGVQPGFSDTSVTGWMVLTLHTARMANIDFDSTRCFTDAEKWLKSVTAEVDGYPRTGYVEPGGQCSRLRTATDYDTVPSMDAINIMSMLFMHKAAPSDTVIREQSAAILQQPPQWKHEKMDFYYWYYASLALAQGSQAAWERWERPLAKTLLDNQRGFAAERHETAETLDEHGSWDPIDAWGAAGGRVYATAINCLTLQAMYRYERLNK